MDTPQNPRSHDRHASGFMIRLPEIFRSKLQVLRRKTKKPMTELVIVALKAFLARFGLWKKADERALEREKPMLENPALGEEPA